jgi:arylformamidase
LRKRNSESDALLTRRIVFAGAATGALALATGPAAAQRCPGPVHVKGPPVWLDLDQDELDDAYDQNVYAFNSRNIDARRTANNEIVRAIIGNSTRASYGSAAVEGIDIFRTAKAGSPSVLFIHGGAWRGGRSSQAPYIAEPFIKAGANFLSLDFSNALETKGDLFAMVDQLRRAVAWTFRNTKSFGGDPERLYLIGHSSGAHLGGCLVTTDWTKLGLPQTVFKGALLGSGIYDLKPVRLSKRSRYLNVTDETEDALSPIRHVGLVRTPLTLTHGSLETPEFQRQSREFYAAVKAAGKPITLLVGTGYNHYETQETLANPYGFMGRPALQMVGIKV